MRRGNGSLIGGGEGVSKGGGGVSEWSTTDIAAAPIRLLCWNNLSFSIAKLLAIVLGDVGTAG